MAKGNAGACSQIMFHVGSPTNVISSRFLTSAGEREKDETEEGFPRTKEKNDFLLILIDFYDDSSQRMDLHREDPIKVLLKLTESTVSCKEEVENVEAKKSIMAILLLF